MSSARSGARHTTTLISSTRPAVWQESYRWLADKICVPLKDAHIGHLGEYYCKLVIEDSRRLLQPHNARPRHGPGERRAS